MRVHAMHDKNNGFRLVGYRIVAENWDEERVLNLNEWSVQRECHRTETAIQMVLDRSHQVCPKKK